jgi:hypothetical protein
MYFRNQTPGRHTICMYVCMYVCMYINSHTFSKVSSTVISYSKDHRELTFENILKRTPQITLTEPPIGTKIGKSYSDFYRKIRGTDFFCFLSQFLAANTSYNPDGTRMETTIEQSSFLDDRDSDDLRQKQQVYHVCVCVHVRVCVHVCVYACTSCVNTQKYGCMPVCMQIRRYMYIMRKSRSYMICVHAGMQLYMTVCMLVCRQKHACMPVSM